MRKLISLTFHKISVLFGGRPLLLPLCLAALLLAFFAVSHSVTAKRSDSVRIAAADECGSELSDALIEELGSVEGVDIARFDSRSEAEDALISGSVEAILVIDPDYDSKLSAGESGLIGIITAPGSVSAELIRETAAGKLIAQRSRVRMLQTLVSEGYDVSSFDEYAAEFDTTSIYGVVSKNGSGADRAVFGQGFPGYEGFAALALMLLIMTLTRRLSSEDARLVSRRMLALKNGRMLDFSSSALALFICGLLFSAAAFALAPERSPWLAAGLICYCLNITGLCMLLSRFFSGRVDVASPVAALVTSILGGCFMDAGSLSPAFAVISKFTPQGQLIAAVNGSPAFALLLLGDGVIMLSAAFAAPGSKKG